MKNKEIYVSTYTSVLLEMVYISFLFLLRLYFFVFVCTQLIKQIRNKNQLNWMEKKPLKRFYFNVWLIDIAHIYSLY